MEISGQNPVRSLRPAPARVAGPPVDAQVPKLDNPSAPDDTVELRLPPLPPELQTGEKIEVPESAKPAAPGPETGLPDGVSMGVGGTL